MISRLNSLIAPDGNLELHSFYDAANQHLPSRLSNPVPATPFVGEKSTTKLTPANIISGVTSISAPACLSGDRSMVLVYQVYNRLNLQGRQIVEFSTLTRTFSDLFNEH